MDVLTLTDLVESAKRQMTSITGMEYDTISEFDQVGDGWAVVIDMLEHRSIPRTQDLLSTFEVRLDNAGRVTRWKRTNRSTRGHHG